MSYALPDRSAALRHHRPAVGVRPHHRRRPVQGSGAEPARRRGGSSTPATSSPTTRSSTPDPNVLIAREATPLPVEVIVRGYITGVTDTALWTPVRRRRPHDLRPPLPRRAAQEHAAPRADRDADDQGREAGPRRTAVVAEVVDRGLVEADAVGPGRGGRARAVRARRRRGLRGRADPRRHEVRVRRRPPTANCC